MSFLVVLIVNDPDQCSEILDGWEAAGVLGATLLESTGLGHIRKAGLRDDMPLMPSIRDLFSSTEVHHRTLFSVVDSQELVDRMVEIAQRIIGNLENPNTGFLFVVPVLQVYGMGKHRQDRSNE